MGCRSIGLADRKRIVKKQLEKKSFRKILNNFFINGDLSQNMAGMKETVTKNKLEKQK